jgi:hypothetical protein
MRFLDDERNMPVIWHQSLLAFVERSVIDEFEGIFWLISKALLLMQQKQPPCL